MTIRELERKDNAVTVYNIWNLWRLPVDTDEGEPTFEFDEDFDWFEHPISDLKNQKYKGCPLTLKAGRSKE